MGSSNLARATIRVGHVSSVDPERATARVKFPDMDDLISYDFQIVQRNTGRNKDYWLPDLEEQVVCLCLGNGLERGFILGSMYSDKDKPPANSQDKRRHVFADGTWFEYDRAEHLLRAHVEGDIDADASGNVAVAAGGNITATAAGNVKVSGSRIDLN